MGSLPVISRNVVTANAGNSQGGGIYCYAAVSIANNAIKETAAMKVEGFTRSLGADGQ